jgi:penicillin-binding protein 1C
LQVPQPFAPLTDWVKRPICTTSGQKPTANCPTVVEEYILPADLAEYENSADDNFHLPPVYDEWLASQPESAWAAGELRILMPREDAYFIAPKNLNKAPAIAFKITAPPNQSVEWRLNNELLATTAEREFSWPMQLGDWVLEVRSGGVRDLVHFQVQPANDALTRPGFSVGK